jgi:hypothetical protein
MASERLSVTQAVGRREPTLVGKPGVLESFGRVAQFVVCAALVFPASVSTNAAPQDHKAQIAVATAILAKPASLTPLPIQIGPQEDVPRNSFIRLRGMPPTVSLTEGYAIGPGSWAVPLIGLPTLKANVPVGISGRSELIITLVAIDGTLLAEARTTLVVEPGATIAPVERTRPEQMPTSSLTPPASLRAESHRKSLVAPQIRELSAEQRSGAEKLLAQGMRYLEQGNIEIARQFFHRAANAGLAEGAMRLAATYDPTELARLGVLGVVADRAEALKWYERARELGAPEAADGSPAKPASDQRQDGRPRR